MGLGQFKNLGLTGTTGSRVSVTKSEIYMSFASSKVILDAHYSIFRFVSLW